MHIAVLAYHSQNANGSDYENNDHIAFESDLGAIARAGIPILSLRDIVQSLANRHTASDASVAVALSCDDGTILDWYDYEHPDHGFQKSFANILRDHLAASGNAMRDMLTSFVIASPRAREDIDQGCYGGLPLSDSSWWKEAAAEGMLAIENHSWDHLHPVVRQLADPACEPGDFYSVDTYESADREIRSAATMIDSELAAWEQQCSLFAYPYGHCNRYLRDVYLPEFALEHKVAGAFTTEAAYVDGDSNIYALPRFVCGSAWRSPTEFSAILDGLLARAG